MKDYITCGAFGDGNVYSDIVVDPVTGDTILCSDLLGDSLFSNITIMEPTYFDNEAVVRKMCEHFQCKGVIMCSQFLITLKEDKAEYREFSNTDNIVHEVGYDLFLDYQFED